MNNDGKITTIRLTEKTKRLLAELGSVSDTYETVIIKLIQKSKKNGVKNGAS